MFMSWHCTWFAPGQGKQGRVCSVRQVVWALAESREKLLFVPASSSLKFHDAICSNICFTKTSNTRFFPSKRVALPVRNYLIVLLGNNKRASNSINWSRHRQCCNGRTQKEKKNKLSLLICSLKLNLIIIMSVSKNIAPTVVLGLIGTWTAFWSLERMVLYSYPTPDTMINSTLHNYMPWSDTPEEWKQAFGGAMSQMYAIDREFFSRIIHVQLSGVIAFCCLINLYLGDDVAALSDAERLTSTKAWIHRFTGRVFQTCVIPWSLYLNYVLFVHGMINFVSNIDQSYVMCQSSFSVTKLIRFHSILIKTGPDCR